MKKITNLEELLIGEKEKLINLEERQSLISKKIKDCKSNIKKYEMMQQTNQMSQLSNALDDIGIPFEDILSAINKGDFLSLQDMIKKDNRNIENA